MPTQTQSSLSFAAIYSLSTCFLSFLPSFLFQVPFFKLAWLKKGDLNLNTLFGFIRLTTVELTTTTVDSSRAIRNVQHLSNKVYLHRV